MGCMLVESGEAVLEEVMGQKTEKKIKWQKEKKTLFFTSDPEEMWDKESTSNAANCVMGGNESESTGSINQVRQVEGFFFFFYVFTHRTYGYNI